MHLYQIHKAKVQRMKNKDKKAFTLIEMIVVMALIAIVGVTVLSVMMSSSNMFNKMQTEGQAKMIASGVMQAIEPQVRFGTNMTIVGARTGDTNRNLYAENGKVYIVYGEKSTSPVDLFGSDFYRGYSVTSLIFTGSGTTVQISITVQSSTDTSITSTLTTSVQNQNTPGGITGNAGYLCYQWLTQPI